MWSVCLAYGADLPFGMVSFMGPLIDNPLLKSLKSVWEWCVPLPYKQHPAPPVYSCTCVNIFCQLLRSLSDMRSKPHIKQTIPAKKKISLLNFLDNFKAEIGAESV